MVELPNYTQVPNEFLDSRMATLSPSAFKVLMAICRKTFGYHKEQLRDRISFSQLRKITGIASNQTVWKAIDELKDDVNKYVIDGHSYFEINATASMQQYYGEQKNDTVTDSVKHLYNNCKGTVTDSVNTKERVKQTSLKKDTAIAVSDTTLYAPLQQAFLSKNDGKFSNYGKEGKAIHAIITKARDRMPEDPASLIKSMLDAFWRLKTADTSAKGFWRGQPFLPSSLSALWDRVLETMRNDEVDPEVMKIINGGGA